LSPDEKVTPHFNYYCCATLPYLDVCFQYGLLPQIGVLFKDLTGFEPDEKYFDALRKNLDRWKQ
jgi:hypothetical protein